MAEEMLRRGKRTRAKRYKSGEKKGRGKKKEEAREEMGRQREENANGGRALQENSSVSSTPKED